MKMTSHRFLISSWCLLLLQLVIIANCEWIQVPLRTHDKQFDLSVEQEIPSKIAGKLEELAISLRVDRNRTKQLDLELDHPVTVTTKTPKAEVNKGSKTKKNNRGESTQVINKRISEPFSIFNFLRSIRDSFFKPQATVKQKIGFLERIRNNILAEIKRRILGLFSVQRQRDGGSRRTKRDEHGGHDISSADGYPLVTICFLTFSVFLIKLVLQIIYILKRKHYSMATGTDPGTVGAVRRLIRKNQNARTITDLEEDEDEEQYLKVMNSIHKSPQ